MARPFLVMVTGVPGSGKTTLGRALAAALGMPFLSRDEVRRGQLASFGLLSATLRDPPPRAAAVDAFVGLVEEFAIRDVSAVVEFVVLPDRRAAMDRLEASARVVIVHTECNDAARRAERRDRADTTMQRAEVLRALGFASVDEYVAAPERALVASSMTREFSVPTLRVRTDDGYDPTLSAVLDWIIETTAP